MFERVLVANRGEIAVRVIRSLHELGVEAVAVHSSADDDALHVRLADRAVRIGPPAAAQSYLNVRALIAAAETTGCEAVHPGYGFLAENPAFVHACAENDLVFIGPSAEVMARMGDKAQAKLELKAAGVPLVPGTDGSASLAEARAAAADLGYPILLKAVAGGGGKGMRLVEEEEQLDRAYSTASAEAEAAFGDGSLYVEKVIVPARHVEVQVLCDAEGGVLTLGERECSIQRRHQKLIEESPSPALTPALREEIEAAAERACRHLGYRNAGTFEFLVGPDGSFAFIELNARLQVEHPVTELVTGMDIVREQVRIAAGEPLPVTGRAPRRGHAIEVRINAEDPEHAFAPSPGTITRFRPPQGPFVRFDTFVEDGAVISPYYDSLVGKLIVWDVDRAGAIARALRALDELELEGVATTSEFAAGVLASRPFATGEYSTSFLEEQVPRSRRLDGGDQRAEVAALRARERET
ncbi:MAG: acetyl-CoA carboxylase biotin carboxylase subunit [Gaiellaceae bacterium]